MTSYETMLIVLLSLHFLLTSIQPVIGDNNKDPLILTPYLATGELRTARKLSKVNSRPFSSVESYSGFFTIDAKFNSNIFFWFFPAQHGGKKSPLLLWLNGGPGSSSLFGLFVENGPFIVNETDFISNRATSWTLTNSILFVDSPVGTGFSFTDAEDGYARSMPPVINGLYSTLRQFFIMFPEYRNKDFYLTGESFAGKYIPLLAQKILEKNKDAGETGRINLKGLSIGNGFIDPENSMNYASFLYELGLMDRRTKEEAEFMEQSIIHRIRRREWIQAFQEYDAYIGYSGRSNNFIAEVTGSNFYYNVLIPKRPPAYDSYTVYVNQSWVREALHVGVGKRYFQNGAHVMELLQGEIMSSVRTVMEELLNDGTLRILLYNGQLDLIVANRLTDSFVESMEGWIWREKYMTKSPRKIWKERGEIPGYYKTLGNFTRLTIRNCGHMVPYDKPKWGYLFMEAFLHGTFDNVNESDFD